MAGRLSYDEAVAQLDAAARFGIHPSLDGISAICEAIGRPQDAFDSIQVAGTNGKTSTARSIAAMLSAHGERAGLFTSPALGARTSQIVVDGRPVTREAFASAVDAALRGAQKAGVRATEFELTTAAALWAFAQARVGWAVLEVGMGGRWDATSVVRSRVAVITGVDIDHEDQLGETREAIASEKAQVIKTGSRAIAGPGTAGVLEVFMSRALEVDAPLAVVTEAPAVADTVFEVAHRPEGPSDVTAFAVSTPRALYDGLRLRAPAFQAGNTAVAIAAAEAALGRALDRDLVARALEAMDHPGRFEVLATEPLVLADGAHNPAAARVLAAALEDVLEGESLTVVLGILEDKDAAGIVQALAPVASRFLVTASSSPRSIAPAALARVVQESTGAMPETIDGVAAAVSRAREWGSVVATGSLTVAAEARRAFADRSL